jgi:amino acid transporter
MGGVLKGVSGVFFAYIGFDAITTTTEECKNPTRDMPRAIFASLILCTVLYVAIALVLTGMVPYHTLRVGDPLAFVFQQADLAPDAKRILVAVIAVSAVVAMTSVLLVFQMGQPRIWMSMSRDGLLPERLGRIHPRFRTPAFATVLTGLGVGVPILFMDLTSSTDVTSIGTLFAFVLVCAGMLNLHLRPDYTFRYRAAGWCPPRLALGRRGLDVYPLLTGVAFYLLLRFPPENLQTVPHSLLDALERIPTLPVYGTLLYIGLRSLWRPQPLVPVLGLLSCLYLMAQVPAPSWGTFALWMLLGLGIYFAYGYRR